MPTRDKNDLSTYWQWPVQVTSPCFS